VEIESRVWREHDACLASCCAVSPSWLLLDSAARRPVASLEKDVLESPSKQPKLDGQFAIPARESSATSSTSSRFPVSAPSSQLPQNAKSTSARLQESLPSHDGAAMGAAQHHECSGSLLSVLTLNLTSSAGPLQSNTLLIETENIAVNATELDNVSSFERADGRDTGLAPSNNQTSSAHVSDDSSSDSPAGIAPVTHEHNDWQVNDSDPPRQSLSCSHRASGTSAGAAIPIRVGPALEPWESSLSPVVSGQSEWTDINDRPSMIDAESKAKYLSEWNQEELDLAEDLAFCCTAVGGAL
jgi:hypothetical protein